MSKIRKPSARKILEQLHEDDASLLWYLLIAAYAIKTGDIPKAYKTTPASSSSRGYTFCAYDFDIDHLEQKDIRNLLRRIDK